jgi:hypothetical protein
MIERFGGIPLLGLNASSRRMAFYGSLALFLPPISNSLIGYGFLKNGCLFHAFSFGIIGCAIHKFVHGFKPKKLSCNSDF